MAIGIAPSCWSFTTPVPVSGKHYLIEVNPRPWDQLSLGRASGVDLSLAAYSDHAALPAPAIAPSRKHIKWIAEDAFLIESLHLLWRHDNRLWSLFRLAAGPRIYAIWSWRDPLPFLAYATAALPALLRSALQAAAARLRRQRRVSEHARNPGV